MPSRDEILAVYQTGPEALVAWVEQLVGAHQLQVANLTARIAQLEARLNEDSHNSYKPPSSDGPAKRSRPRSLRRRSGRPSGGQAGHPGSTLCLEDNPDTIVTHGPAACTWCGADLDTAPEIKRERCQMIDLPKPRLVITEHQVVQKVCPACQTVTAGEFPASVTQPVQYGPHTKAVAVSLQTYQFPGHCVGEVAGCVRHVGTRAGASRLLSGPCRLWPKWR